MKNTAAKGARCEREILHFLNNKGFSVMRAPSSGGWLSPVDVVAMKCGRIIAMECKNHKKKPRLDQKQVQKFREWCDKAGATGMLVWQMPGTGSGSEWKFLRLEDVEANQYQDENWFDLDTFMKVFCD